MIDMKSTVLCATSSYALLLAEEIEKRGIKDKIHLKKGVIGSERWGEAMRKRISEELGIELYDIYGLTEVYGPGIGMSCAHACGMHLWDDFIYFEVIDPKTGEPVPDGELGELVITTLRKQGAPLVRYRTRDITRIIPGQCACGRTHRRIDRLHGRTDDMLIIRGVNVFPSQIETVLLNHGYAANYQIIVDRVNNTDTFEVMVEMTPEIFSDSLAKISQAEKALVDALKSMLGIAAKVKLVAPKSITRSEGKAVRVIDKRKI